MPSTSLPAEVPAAIEDLRKQTDSWKRPLKTTCGVVFVWHLTSMGTEWADFIGDPYLSLYLKTSLTAPLKQSLPTVSDTLGTPSASN